MSRISAMPKPLRVTASAICALALTPAALPAADEPPPDKPGQPQAPPTVDRRWLDRLPRLDRALLDELIGYAPPAFPDDLTWVAPDPLTWEQLRGTVVLLQSWTSGSPAGRSMLTRMERLADDFDEKDLRVIMLHTPEDAEDAERFFEMRTPELPVALDARGPFCDALGVYRRPVNLLIDRNGVVRYAGLNPRGLDKALKQLVARSFDADATPPKPPEPEPEDDAPGYPPMNGRVTGARDLRGHRAPDFHVDEWVTDRPDARGKVVVICFIDSDDDDCLAAFPHLNQLTTRFLDNAVILVLSEETEREVRSTLRREDAKFAAAVDFREKMYEAAGVTVIPHCLVMSSDWIVRWQGRPERLSAETMQQIIAANTAALQPAPPKLNRHRWTGRR